MLLQHEFDLAEEGELEVLDQARVRYILEVLLVAKLLPLVHIPWLNVYRFVVLHEFFALLTEVATVLVEEAAQLHQVEDRDHSATTQSNELVHKLAHFRLAILLGISETPLTTGLVLIIGNDLPLGPEDLKAGEELVVGDPVCQWGMIRDEAEKHLSKEVVFDAEHLWQVLLNRLQCQVLYRLVLSLACLLSYLCQVNDS